jgi:hypothetical protein
LAAASPSVSDPFYAAANTSAGTCHARFSTMTPPPSVRADRLKTPAEMADLVAQPMKVDPDARYPSAAATTLTPFTR